MKKLLCLLALTASCFGTTSVTGHISTLGTGSVTSGALVRFYLRGCGRNQPRITGTGAIAPQVSRDNVFYFDIPGDGSGNVSGTLYSTRDAAGTGNGEIECGGSLTAVWYGMVILNGSVAGPEVPITAKSGATIDISNVTPNSTQPVVTAPTGDNTYARLDGGNTPFTGPIIAPKINNVVNAGSYANLAAVQSALGSTNPFHILIPSNYSGTDCPAVQNNNVFEDYRAGGRTGSGTSSFICTENIIQYNTKTPGLTDAMVRSEMTRTAVDATGSIVSNYMLTHLKNATVTSGVVDGASTEAQTNGTLSGTLATLMGNESVASALSTGGTITRAIGTEGYVFNQAGNTTQITDAIGLLGRGCNGTIAGQAPTNCYGGYFYPQLGTASSRNYALGVGGVGLLVYDGNVASGGFDCEDTTHATHPCFRTNSSNAIVIQAMDAVGGVTIAASNGAGRYVLNDAGATISNPLTTTGLLTSSGGITNNNAGIAAAGAISGATTGAFSGAVTVGSIKAGASGSTISDTRELVQSSHACGSTSTCANTANQSAREIWGTITLSTGAATLTGITAYTSTSSFVCMCTDQTSAAACKAVPASTTSVTFAGTGSDVLAYRCVGN